MRVALGWKARTGRAAFVAVGGEVHDPLFVLRGEIKLLPEGAFATYHAAAEMKPAAAREYVKRSIATTHRLAASGIGGAARRLAGAGHEVCGCGVLVGTGMPNWTTDEIIAVHVRMHKAEGELFRDALVVGARECKLELTTLPEKSAVDAAAAAMGVDRARLDGCIAALGRAAGPPWTKDQKEASAAALATLHRAGRR